MASWDHGGVVLRPCSGPSRATSRDGGRSSWLSEAPPTAARPALPTRSGPRSAPTSARSAPLMHPQPESTSIPAAPVPPNPRPIRPASARGACLGRRHGAGQTSCAERSGSTCWPVRAVTLRRCSGPSRARSRDGGRFRLIALIEEAAVIERILRHLHLPTEVRTPRPGRAPPPIETGLFNQDTDTAVFDSNA